MLTLKYPSVDVAIRLSNDGPVGRLALAAIDLLVGRSNALAARQTAR